MLTAENWRVFDQFIVVALPMVDVVLAALLLVRGSWQDRPTLAVVSAGFSLYAISDLVIRSR